MYDLNYRRYEACAEAVLAAFGLSASSVSQHFIRTSAQQLRELSERRLEQDEVVVIFLDGKTFVDESMVIALGMTWKGEKKFLGFVQTARENEAVCSEFLRGLVTRGLRTDQELLCVNDGAKGCARRSRPCLDERLRCNAVSGMNGRTRCGTYPRETRPRGNTRPTYAEAGAALPRLRQELQTIDLSAGTSLGVKVRDFAKATGMLAQTDVLDA